MNKPNDGGPAFPAMKKAHAQEEISAAAYNARLFPGMSLRAYLAGKAMKVAYSEDMTFEQMAKWSCDYADAMLAELGKMGGRMEVRRVDLREAEGPAPKFKVNDPVRVRAGIGVFAGKVGVVEAVFPDTLGEGFKYRVHITDGMRETYYEDQLEAAGEEGK